MKESRFLTEKECETHMAQAQSEALIWATFLEVIKRGDFVLVDESSSEPIYRIAKNGTPLIPVIKQ